jgi:transglutaminase-like putative cysteine protease
MRRIQINHVTRYLFPQTVTLLPHTAHLRPREGHDMRIESSRLDITPAFNIRWQRDVYGNSLAVIEFTEPSGALTISSEVIVEHYEEQPLAFDLAQSARQFPFHYDLLEQIDLMAYQLAVFPQDYPALRAWMDDTCRVGQLVDTIELLETLNRKITNTLEYRVREEPGVQSPAQTLRQGYGSCRDFATLFIEICRYYGLASRFVSGYLVTAPQTALTGSTHAWAEVYLPGNGWRGFDPTSGQLVSGDHIAVAVHRHPEAIPPVAGKFVGPTSPLPNMNVEVSVKQL